MCQGSFHLRGEISVSHRADIRLASLLCALRSPRRSPRFLASFSLRRNRATFLLASSSSSFGRSFSISSHPLRGLVPLRSASARVPVALVARLSTSTTPSATCSLPTCRTRQRSSTISSLGRIVRACSRRGSASSATSAETTFGSCATDQMSCGIWTRWTRRWWRGLLPPVERPGVSSSRR